MTLVIEPEHLAIVTDVLVTHLPLRTRVWAYGSRVRGTRVWRGSDLDLLVDAGERLPHEVLSAMAEDFSESFIPYVVDLHDWHRTDSDFLARIAPDLVLLPLPGADHEDPR